MIGRLRAPWDRHPACGGFDCLAAGLAAVAEREGMNVNRAGVVFVPAVERRDRDLAALALRLGESSRAVFAELIDRAPG